MSPKNSTHGAFVVIAEFVVKAGKMNSFLEHAYDDAHNSTSTEPGCLQFDVLRSAEDDSTVVFYEVYTNKQAFNDHLQTAHVERFRQALPEHIQTERPVKFLDRH